MHIHHRHPEVQQQSRLHFSRLDHALFGVPVCRFCHTRLFDWSSLRKHIEEGHCSWIQQACQWFFYTGPSAENP